jgi:uncharacterized repeat protein (TIGR03803 family)
MIISNASKMSARLVPSGAVLLLAVGLAHATTPTYTEIEKFNGKDGASPESVIVGPNGVLYGVASGGGSAGQGVVFSLTPPTNGGTVWTKRVIYSFQGGVSDGAAPLGRLVADLNGALYGTTSAAGAYGFGTVFKLTPPSAGGHAPWTETTLYNFQGGTADGATPLAGLVFDSFGALYGTTSTGGSAGQGAVFQLSPPSSSGGPWTETVLYSFQGGTDGATPAARVVFGPGGALYGTTLGGGSPGQGVVFELAPPLEGQWSWAETVLFTFTGYLGGGFPQGVTFGPDGALYGAAETQGANGWGVVYRLAPVTSGPNGWTEADLYAFTGQADGGYPVGPLVFGTNGALYGATTIGGAPNGGGTIYKLTPPAKGKTKWGFSALYQFQTAADGLAPLDGVVFGPDGALFGTASAGGGKSYSGVVFELQ